MSYTLTCWRKFFKWGFFFLQNINLTINISHYKSTHCQLGMQTHHCPTITSLCIQDLILISQYNPSLKCPKVFKCHNSQSRESFICKNLWWLKPHCVLSTYYIPSLGFYTKRHLRFKKSGKHPSFPAMDLY